MRKVYWVTVESPRGHGRIVGANGQIVEVDYDLTREHEFIAVDIAGETVQVAEGRRISGLITTISGQQDVVYGQLCTLYTRDGRKLDFRVIGSPAPGLYTIENVRGSDFMAI